MTAIDNSELVELRHKVAELTLENVGLRYERDELLKQKQGTQEWMGELMRTSPIAISTAPMDPAHRPVLSAWEIRQLAAKVALQYPDKKIMAIKELRSLTHLGLKEAKDAIDATGLC